MEGIPQPKEPVIDYKEVYLDCIQMIELMQDKNPELYEKVEWVLDASPVLVVILNEYVRITEWTNMSLRRMAEVSKKSYRKLKEIEAKLNE